MATFIFFLQLLITYLSEIRQLNQKEEEEELEQPLLREIFSGASYLLVACYQIGLW